jgi:hypothetical protein
MSCCGNKEIDDEKLTFSTGTKGQKKLHLMTESGNYYVGEAEYKAPVKPLPVIDNFESLAELDTGFFVFSEEQKKCFRQKGIYAFKGEKPTDEERNPIIKSAIHDLKYKGQKLAGTYEGRAHSQGLNGNFYIGMYRNGVKEGTGAEYMKNGDYFIGQFSKDQKLFGEYTSVKGTYTGPFKNEVFEGVGEFNFANGRSYKGDYVGGKREGNGVYKWPSGAVYVGQFKNGLQHGQGRFTEDDGKIMEGTYENGLPGVIKYISG